MVREGKQRPAHQAYAGHPGHDGTPSLPNGRYTGPETKTDQLELKAMRPGDISPHGLQPPLPGACHSCPLALRLATPGASPAPQHPAETLQAWSEGQRRQQAKAKCIQHCRSLHNSPLDNSIFRPVLVRCQILVGPRNRARAEFIWKGNDERAQ